MKTGTWYLVNEMGTKSGGGPNIWVYPSVKYALGSLSPELPAHCYSLYKFKFPKTESHWPVVCYQAGPHRLSKCQQMGHREPEWVQQVTVCWKQGSEGALNVGKDVASKRLNTKRLIWDADVPGKMVEKAGAISSPLTSPNSWRLKRQDVRPVGSGKQTYLGQSVLLCSPRPSCPSHIRMASNLHFSLVCSASFQQFPSRVQFPQLLILDLPFFSQLKAVESSESMLAP